MIHQGYQSACNIFIELANLKYGIYKPRGLNTRKRNSCASALFSLLDVQPSSVYKSHIVVTVDATYRPVEFSHLHAWIEDYFHHGGQRFKILVYNLRNG